MKHILRLTTIFTLLLFFGGSVWGQTNASYDFSAPGAVSGLNEASPGITLDANIGFGSFKNSGTSNPVINSGQLRLYQNATKGGSIKIYASNGVTITQVVVHASNPTGPAAFSVDGGASSPVSNSSGTYTMSGLSGINNVEFWCTGSSSGTRIYVDDFEVSYTSGSSDPTITVSPSTLTGFSYDEGSGPSDEQSFTIEGSNLTSDISIATATNYEISTGTGVGFVAASPITLTPSGGTVATTTIYVRLKSGLAIGDYNGEAITATSTDADDKTVTCSGSVSDPNAHIEDFTNFPETSSSYASGSFIGQDGSTWTYTDCRGDQKITNETPCLRNNSSANVYSGTINNGIGTLNFNYMQAFSTNVNLDVLVNDQVVGTVTSSGEEGTIKNSGNITVNVSGDFVIKFQQNSSVGGQVAIDNVEWSSYGSVAPEPTNHPTVFTATANSSSQITTTWTDAVAGDQAPTGYLVLANTTGTFSDPVDGTAQSDDTDLSDGTGVKNIGTSVETYQWSTGLSAATQYYFKIFSYNGSGTSINYKTGGTVPTANATTESVNDNNSEVCAPSEQLAARNISSTTDVEMEEIVPVFKIVIEDKASGDGLATIVKNIRLKPHTTNTADWTDNIQGLTAYDGSNYYSFNADVTDSYIDLTFFDEEELSVGDGQTVELTLNLYLNSSDIVDGAVISFMVDADDHGFTADATGSGFASSFFEGGFNSNDITIDVDATELQFKQQPSNAQTNTSISPAPTVAFTDENGNIDLSYETADVSMTAVGAALVSSPVVVAIAANGLATFSTLQFSTSGTDVTITASDKDDYLEISAEVTSDAFDVISIPNVFFSEYIEGSSNNKAYEIYNGTGSDIDLVNFSVKLASGGGGWGTTLSWEESNMLLDGDVYVVSNSSAAAGISVLSDETSGTTFFNGDDALGLFYNDQLIDVIGSPTNDPGTGWTVDETNNATVDHTLVRKNSVTSGNAEYWTDGSTGSATSEWIINVNDDFNSLGWHGSKRIWKGGSNNSWSNASNWRGHKLPGADNNVTLPSTAEVTIEASKTDVSINSLTLNSDANGTASLIIDGGLTIAEGSATSQLYFSGYSAKGVSGWHLLSSPVNNMVISGSDFEPGTASPNLDDFYAWSESDWEWKNYKVGGNNITNFTNGLGYLVSYETTAIKDFTGTFNTSDVPFSNLSFTDNRGWHLLGNPFQSAIQWTSSVDWAKTNISAGAKIMNPGGSYTDITVGGTDIIPANQGFFIEVTDATNSITIPHSACTHSATAFYKNSIANRLTLRATQSNSYVETWIQMMEHATMQYDVQYDIHFLGGMYGTPYLYSILENDEHVSTNRIPQLEDNMEIPLGFSVVKDGEVTLTWDELESFKAATEITLTDLKENVHIKLNEQTSYTFTASTSDAADRFLLHFKSTTAVEDMETLDASIYTYDNKIYISGLEEVNNATVELFTVDGRRILAEQFSGVPVVQVGQKLPLGCYVVRLTSENQTMSKKIVLN